MDLIGSEPGQRTKGREIKGFKAQIRYTEMGPLYVLFLCQNLVHGISKCVLYLCKELVNGSSMCTFFVPEFSTLDI